MVFDPVPYLPLLEQKTGALDQAAPLVEWELPEEFATLRRLMEARMIKAGLCYVCAGLAVVGNVRDGRSEYRRQKCAAHGRDWV